MDIKQTIIDSGFRFNKKFGQNFITDTNLLSAICRDAGIMPTDTVVEIGPGAGSLTRELSQAAKRVIAYEVDENLRSVLDKTLDDCRNVEVVYKDIMKVPMSEIEKGVDPYKVVANLPYYITTPILMQFIEQGKNVESLTLMVQSEVADRLCAPNDTKDYGSVTVAVQAVSNVTICRNVNRNMFYPVPHVDSAVIRIDIDRHKFSIDSAAAFRKTVKSAFAMRRKTLINNLTVAFGFSREKCEELLAKLGVEKNIRGEVLSVEQFVRLANLINSL